MKLYWGFVGLFFLSISIMLMGEVHASIYSDENHCGQRILSEITGKPLEDVLFSVGYGRTYPYDLLVYLRHHGYPNATYGVGYNEDAEIWLVDTHWVLTSTERTQYLEYNEYYNDVVVGWVKLG